MPAAVCALLIGLALGGRLLVHTADQGLATIQRELDSTIALEDWNSNVPESSTPVPRSSTWPIATPHAESGIPAQFRGMAPAHSEMLDVTFSRDLAAVEVLETRVYPDGQPSAQRKVRFYCYDGVSWTPCAPDDAYWGPQRTLETEHLVFHYRKRDRGVVEAAATGMDSAYAAMQEALGLPFLESKLEVVVDTSPLQVLMPQLHGNELRVKSPSLLPLPDSLPPDQLLVWQALPLLVEHMIQESETADPVQETWNYMARVVGQWLVLQHNDLQAAWIADVRQWQRAELAAKDTAKPPSPGDELGDLCIKHRIQERYLWFAGTGEPFACVAGSGLRDTLALNSELPLTLSRLFQGSSRPAYTLTYQPSPIVATTVLDYAVAAHGSDAVARLWQGFHSYRTWDELIPAVFSVSAREFEAGWQEWQLARGRLYDISQTD